MERVKISKKTILILVGLFLVQAFFFLYSVNVKEDAAKEFGQGEYLEYDEEYIQSQEEYISNYHSSIEDIIKQADAMSGISIFSKIDSFSESNLNRTKEDYKRVLEVEPKAFNDIFIKQYFDYTVVGAFVLLAGIFIAFSLVDSKKTGLRCIIHSGKNGRVRLVLSKMATLFMWDAIIVILFYIGNLLISAVRFDGNIIECLAYPIQSVSEFAKYPWEMSIGTFLIFFVAYKIVVLFMISLVIWLIMYITDNVIISMAVAGVLGGIFYLLYCFIDANNPLNYFRYCNPWYLMTDASFFTEYKNLKWYESAVNKDVFIGIMCLIVTLVTMLTAIIVGMGKYPCSSKVRKMSLNMGIFTKVKKWFVSIPEKLSVVMVEYYKVFIKQKGMLFFLAMLLILISQVDTEQVHRYMYQEMYYDFMDAYEGMPSKESEKYIENLESELSQLEKEYVEALKAYHKEEISVDDWISISTKYDMYESDRIFLREIKEQQTYLTELKKDRNIDGWHVNLYGYNHLFVASDTIGNIALIFAVVLICSGIFAFETKSASCAIVRGCRDGRQKTFGYKLQVAVVSTTIMYLIATVMEIMSVRYVYGLSGWSAPVQSIPTLSFVSFDISIGAFVTLMYMVKGFVIVCLSVCVCIVSMWSSRKNIIIVLFVLCMPALLGSAGLTGFENYSIISIMSIGPLLLRTQSIAITGLITVVVGIAGSMCLISGYRKWCVT